jgi:phosphonate transport system substrate-binding protein
LKIKSLKDLKGKRIGFVDKKSSSGYLYPLLALKKIGLKESDFKSVTFSGSHSKSVDMLNAKEVDAIAVFADDSAAKKNAWIKYSEKTKSDPKAQLVSSPKVLWVSEPIPNDPFCVRKDFYEAYPKLTHSLMSAVIDAVENLVAKKELKDFVGAKTLAPATSKQYDPVRDVVKSLGIQSN